MRKSFQELTIRDAFMFAAFMATYPEECRKLISVSLDMEILEVAVVTEKSMSFHPEYHGIRLDVMAVEKGKKRRFNVEMQVKNKDNLPKRSRYYHSQMDMDALLSGENYENLPDTYVIFICDFDLFGERLYRYTFKSQCQENDMLMADGRTTVFLNTKGENDQDVPSELVKFLKYVSDSGNEAENLEDPFVRELADKIAAIKMSRSWEARFMLFEEMLKDEREEGREEGREEERNRLNRLIQLLAQQQRVNDIIRAAEDREFQNKLFEEFGL